MIVWKYYRTTSFLYVAAGMILHQVIDAMWLHPVNWYYPFLGPYDAEIHPDYVGQVIRSELSSPTEWVFLVALFVIAAFILVNLHQNRQVPENEELATRERRHLLGGLFGVGMFVLGLSILIIYILQPVYGI